MKWMTLYNKIGKQQASLIQNSDVVVIIDNKEIKLDIKFKQNNEPYLVPKRSKLL